MKKEYCVGCEAREAIVLATTECNGVPLCLSCAKVFDKRFKSMINDTRKA